jgi:UDP-glucose:(heptosyl)LPS alpha-1,3-glucosyltransferase
MQLAFCLYKHFPYSGLSLDMLRIVEECRDRGHDTTVYTGSWEGQIPEGVEVVIVKHFGMTNHTRAGAFHRSLKAILRSRQFDIVIGFNKIPDMDIYYCGDYCYVGRSALRHSWFYRFTPRYIYYSKFEKGVFDYNAKTLILSLSEREKSIYQQYYLTQDSRFESLPPTLEQARWTNLNSLPPREKIRQDLNVGPNKNLILLIGSGFATKGLDRAIYAMASLPSELLEDTLLFVVGQDKIEPYARQAKKLGVSDHVIFLGGRSDVPALMRAGDLLIHPAYSETSGGVLLEAIVSGLPVLVTPVCGYAPHINLANAGHVLRKRFSQDELNDKLVEMLTSDQRPIWRENGLKYGKDPGLYVMPQKAVDFIEKAGRVRCQLKNVYSDERLYINNELRTALGEKANFDDLMEITGKIYRKALGRQTLRFSCGDKDYFIKMHNGVGWAEIIKNLSYLRAPVVGALNEWHGVHRLNDLEIDTMTVAAYGLRGKNPAKKHSFIITEALPTETSLEDYCKDWKNNPPTSLRDIRLKRWILFKVAETARVIHENGANHRDFYLCHFLLDAVFDDDHVSDQSKLYLIDLHRIQLRRRTPKRWAIKDVSGLYYSSMDIGLSKRDLFRFMKLYSGKSLRETLNDKVFWDRVRKRGEKLYLSEKRKAKKMKSSNLDSKVPDIVGK